MPAAGQGRRRPSRRMRAACTITGDTGGATMTARESGREEGQAARALLLGEYDNMLACVRCGLCLTSCPTYVLTLHEAEGPRGRIAMARALAEGHLTVTPDLVAHELNCLVCEACTAICPAGVHMEPLQVALRATL
ncbi:MAG: hypothetical protein C4290_11315, partial [Chloroflexota bacterium]